MVENYLFSQLFYFIVLDCVFHPLANRGNIEQIPPVDLAIHVSEEHLSLMSTHAPL